MFYCEVYLILFLKYAFLSGGDSSMRVESSVKNEESHESSDNKIESFSDYVADVEMSNEEEVKQEKLTDEEKHFAEEKAEKERQWLQQKADEEKLQLEKARKAEEERLSVERERKADEERRLECERKEEERLRLEREKKAEDERLQLERERKAEEERQRLVKERKAADERQRLEQQRKAAEERQRLEQERKAAEERQRFELERKAAEERQRIAQEKKSEEDRQRLEKERKAAATERRMAEEAEMQKEQERWLVEEQMKRAQEEHKKRLQAEEQKRVLEEQQRLMEEELEQQNNDKQVYHLQENETDFSSQPDMNTGSYVAIPSAMNIIPPPPPTVLMSNIPPPPPNSMIPTPPAGFPLSVPINISAPAAPVQPFITQLGQETNSVAPINDLTNNDVSEKMDTSEDSSAEIKLPQALEKVLALKTERAQQLGIDPDAVVQPVPAAEDKTSSSAKTNVVTLVSIDEDEYGDEEDKNKKNSKSRRRKKKKKKKQHNKIQAKNEIHKRSESVKPKETSVDIDIEYVQEVIDITDPMYAQFMKIFEKFKLTEGEKEKDEIPTDAAKDASKEEILNAMAFRKKPIDLNDDDEDQDEDKKEEDKPKLSKRKLKKLSRMTVAELKQKVCRPELVEMHDVTAKDPVLLLHLKASRNTVPVPRHWCFKRKYLQGKRGIEKPAFELPDFIKRTGIMEMRQALQEKEDQKTMKAKMRERVRPKLGKIDIDYQKLHDAFFKWQTKPRMTIHGDLYYEGKEFETRLKEKKPGDLSDDLRTALGMPTGPNANKCPPPWLIAMQRYGPPPSYPNLKIPGLNAPIPDSCSFGYHAGGWGKPPVDETGRPLYGDVFGTQIAENQPNIQEEEIDHTLWGELESESSEEEEEEEDEEEEEEEEKQEDETGLVTPAEGLITPSGFSSIPAGMETPDMIELRKRKIEAEKEGGETPALYTILPEKKNERVGAAMMGSTHTYDLAAAIPASKLKIPGTTSVPPQGIEVALDPSELEMDSAAMAARYEQTMREQQSQLEKEDLSDMVAEHAARQKNKRKKQQLDSAKPPKKYKEFKF